MPAGRPTKYEPEYAERAREMCELGATDYELAQAFDVNKSTIYRWKMEHEEFCNALKTAKNVADERVERSLYQRAVGYTFESEKIFNDKGTVVRADCVEHVPPDTTACIFWLKNRRKDQWRDRQPEFGEEDGNAATPARVEISIVDARKHSEEPGEG